MAVGGISGGNAAAGSAKTQNVSEEQQAPSRAEQSQKNTDAAVVDISVEGQQASEASETPQAEAAEPSAQQQQEGEAASGSARVADA